MTEIMLRSSSRSMARKMTVMAVVIAIVAAVTFVVILPAAIGCTLGGVTGPMAAKGHIFFGQTCDNPWWPTRHTLWVIQPEKGYKYIGTKAYIWGFWTGMNEKGFGWAGAYVFATDDPDPEGIDRFDIGPMLLEKCETVYDAIEILENTPRSADFPTRNAIMGDAQGNLALVEIAYSKIHAETLTRDGYVVRTNHFISDEMKDLDKVPDDYVCERFVRGNEWFDNKTWLDDPQWPWYSWGHWDCPGIHVEDMFGYLTYVYLTRLDNLRSGPGTAMVMEPKKLTYWFSYGWPSGNLPRKEDEHRQICQNMTWGTFIPFRLKEMPPGQYTTELGQLTPLGVQYLFSHFKPKQQKRFPAWTRYQSDDPMKPFYKPAEDIESPDGYAPKENPYGPAGFSGCWSSDEGLVSCDCGWNTDDPDNPYCCCKCPECPEEE